MDKDLWESALLLELVSLPGLPQYRLAGWLSGFVDADRLGAQSDLFARR